MTVKKIKFSILITIAIVIILFLYGIVSLSGNSIAYAAENLQYTDNPTVTILTHGLGGTPIDWSNDNLFIYDEYKDNDRDPDYLNYYQGAYYTEKSLVYKEDLLIEKLRQKSNGNVYVLSSNGFKYDKFDIEPNSPSGYRATAVTSLDFSKHCIIVYNSNCDFNADTDTAYTAFKNSINDLVNKYKNTHNNTYPKLNLIGHSMGTIINLKYATEYPDRVDSMFALGGLFNGAKLGKAIDSLNLEGETVADILNMFETGFVQDMFNDTYVANMKQAWNQAVAGKSIKAYAVASSIDVEFLKAFVQQDIWFQGLVQDAAARNAISNVITALQLIARGSTLGGFPYDDIKALYLTMLARLYGMTELSSQQTNQVAAAINGVFDTAVGNPVIPFDGFLEASTQAADGYSNFSRMYRVYGRDTDFSHRSQNEPGFPHNLETSDERTINYILSNIDMGQTPSTFEYTVSNGKATITRINKSATTGSSLTIPSTIDGNTVTQIGQYAFADDFFGNTQITSVIIPSTVTEIGFGAFMNCKNLTSVQFSGSSNLQTVYAYAFYGCTSLNVFSAPNSLTTVHEYAFSNTAFTTFNINRISNLSVGVFSDCKNLTTFTKNSANSQLNIDGSKAIYGGGKLYAYAVGNAGGSYTVPNGITEIRESAFKGASKLTSVTLNEGLTYIGNNTFEGSGLTSVVIHQNCANICSYAFGGCNLSNATIYASGNTQIGEGAFNAFSASGNFKVPQSALTYYRNLSNLTIADDKIQPITFTVSFNANGGSAQNSITAKYGQSVGLPMNLSRIGYEFDGWYRANPDTDANAVRFVNNSLYMDKKNITLYAKWVAKNDGNLQFNANGGEGTLAGITVKWNEAKVLPNCTFVKNGYDFTGWATSSNGAVVYKQNQSYVFQIEDTLLLYAKWVPHEYTISYDKTEYNYSTQGFPVSYNVEQNKTFPEAVRVGYAFYGWFVNTYYQVNSTSGLSGDITLKPAWTVTYSMGSTNKTTLSDVAMILDFGGYGAGSSVNKSYTISNKTAYLTLKNAANLKDIYLYIEKGRPTEMTLIFDNFSCTGQYGKNAIYAPGLEVHMYCSASSTIKGGVRVIESISDGIDEEIAVNCSAALVCANLIVPDSSVYRGHLKLIGGKGRDGVNGANGSNGAANAYGGNGENGENGIRGGFGVVAGKIQVYSTARLDIYGGEGGRGGDGGNGGNSGKRTGEPAHGQVGGQGYVGGYGGNGGCGGYGGIAIFALYKCEFYSGTNVYLKSGMPGDGGNGGAGGKGGQGQKGGPGKFGVHAAAGGKGGSGGNGGNGGAIRAITTIMITTLAIISVTDNYTVISVTNTASAGYGGAGGAGGAGGQGGTKWPTGNLAESGSTGARGANGSNG